MSLLLHIIMTYIKENIITKLQNLYSLLRNPGEGNNLPVLFVKNPLCTGNLLPACKIFIERPADWDSLHNRLRDVPWENIFKLHASAATSEFCEWVGVGIGYINLIENIRSSLIHLHGFQLLVLLP